MRKLLIYLVLASTAMATYVLMTPRNNWARSAVLQSHRGIVRIGGALQDFSEDNHGELPRRLSDLVPVYLHTNELCFVFPPYDRLMKALRSADAPSQRAAIERQSGYVYLGNTGAVVGIIAYERFDAVQRCFEARKDGRVFVLGNNFLPTRLQTNDVMKLLRILKNAN